MLKENYYSMSLSLIKEAKSLGKELAVLPVEKWGIKQNIIDFLIKRFTTKEYSIDYNEDNALSTNTLCLIVRWGKARLFDQIDKSIERNLSTNPLSLPAILLINPLSLIGAMIISSLWSGWFMLFWGIGVIIALVLFFVAYYHEHKKLVAFSYEEKQNKE